MDETGKRARKNGAACRQYPLSVNGVEKAVTKRIISRKCSRHVSSLHLQSRFPVHSPHRHSTDSPSSSTSSASSTFLPIKQPFVSSLSPPSPCSASAQTDENFDVFVNETIAGLADRAIGDAIANLRIEFLEGLLMKGNECHKRTTMSLKSELEKRKQELSTAERKIDDLERSHQAALDTCQRLTIRAIRNLEALEKTRRRVRSIATGEVHSIRDDGRIELMNTEINKDFLPWLIGKAESTYRHQSANSIANSKQTYHSFKV
ncbi:unnamed protein product, partial [Mesorhabditis belari]|uniref:Uncharacterized protein n=1 Tax=Mesorhabditis belari TaxID=2138241 RepID=A0AAF3EG62_9BILA